MVNMCFFSGFNKSIELLIVILHYLSCRVWRFRASLYLTVGSEDDMFLSRLQCLFCINWHKTSCIRNKWIYIMNPRISRQYSFFLHLSVEILWPVSSVSGGVCWLGHIDLCIHCVLLLSTVLHWVRGRFRSALGEVDLSIVDVFLCYAGW